MECSIYNVSKNANGVLRRAADTAADAMVYNSAITIAITG